MTRKRGPNHAIVGWLVDRCHVGQSHRAVIKYVVSRLRKPCWGTWRAMTRARRRSIMRECITRHDSNRDLYRQVMSGRCCK